MAKRIDLRAYQESIAGRLAAAQEGDGAPALLGFESNGARWLVALPDAGEVLPPPAIAPVPLTHPWFAGLANVHGELAAVVDFALFCGGAATPRDAATRLLRVGARHGGNSALLVERVFGLKRGDALFDAAPDAAQYAAPDPAADWRGATLTDAQGTRWQVLKIDRLLADPVFADAALPEDADAVASADESAFAPAP